MSLFHPIAEAGISGATGVSTERRKIICRRHEPWIAKPFENHVGVHVITTRNL
jgi:hypothetical protein